MEFAVNPRDQHPLLLHALMDRGPAVQPDNLIITKVKNGYHTLTFKEHFSRAKRLASALTAWGVRHGDRVGTLLWNNGRHMCIYHAVSCMGAILHTLNLRLGPKELGYIIRDANDRVVFMDSNMTGLLKQVHDLKEYLGGVELMVHCGDDEKPGKGVPSWIPKGMEFEQLLDMGKNEFVWPMLKESDIHAICYTSGTTGNPKGAAYSQRSTYLHTMMAAGADMLGIKGSSIVLPVVPMFHVLSWGVPFVAMMTGCRVVFNNHNMDPASLLDCMCDWKVQFSTGVPTVWQGVRAEIEKRGTANIKPKLALEVLTCGGSAPPEEMMLWYLENLGVSFIQGWGMTEMNPLGSLGRTVAKFADLDRTPAERFKNCVKAGLPVFGLELRIANPEDLDKDMPAGEPGELLVRGPWIIQEYFKTPALDKFHKGWLITGDVAKVDEEGAIVISDRSKDVIKSGGEWISSIDLENDITAIPEITMACVVAVPHPKWDERPVAIVVVGKETKPDTLTELVRSHLSKKWAKFQLPDDVIAWPEIPLTSTGKMDKKNVRAKLADEKYVLPELRTQSKL